MTTGVISSIAIKSPLDSDKSPSDVQLNGSNKRGGRGKHKLMRLKKMKDDSNMGAVLPGLTLEMGALTE